MNESPLIPDPPPIVANAESPFKVASAKSVFELLKKKKAPPELFALATMTVVKPREDAARTDGAFTDRDVAKLTETMQELGDDSQKMAAALTSQQPAGPPMTDAEYLKNMEAGLKENPPPAVDFEK